MKEKIIQLYLHFYDDMIMHGVYKKAVTEMCKKQQIDCDMYISYILQWYKQYIYHI